MVINIYSARRIVEEKSPAQTEQYQYPVKTKTKESITKERKTKSVQSERGGGKEGCICMHACMYGYNVQSWAYF